MILVIFFSLFIPPLWLSWHLLRWKELALWKRGVGVLFLFLCSQIYPIDLWLFGSLSGPEMPRWLLLAQALALVALIISFLLVFCKDVLGWIFKKRSLKDKGEDGKERALVSDSLKDPKRRLFLQKGLSAFAFSCPLVGGLAGGYGVSQGIKDPILNRQKLKILDLPQGLAGFKIIQVTDLHIATLTTKTWIDNLVALINSQKPDIICITGDLADGIPSYSSPDGLTRLEVAQGLGKLKAPLGVFACTGNHEYYSDYKGWMEIFTRLGINFLHNRAEVLSYQGSKLVLAGRNDKQASYFFKDSSIPACEIFKGKP
ncbi:MAG: metallophosphoesterase, partial [Desulfovibrionaceae bacterium]|nr:metallophosphoesterase [Desulfovibrionaceae bacterium]